MKSTPWPASLLRQMAVPCTPSTAESATQSLVQASGNPQELQRVFEEGANYPAHQGQNVPDWKATLSDAQRNALLNFLAAPDGQRLFEINCSGCHGVGVTFTGSESQLRDLISKGGQHLTMPAWQGTLSEDDLDTLAAYVTNPTASPAGKTLFGQHCSACHADKVPSAPDMVSARKMISGGGAHVTMPVWGKILTAEQLDALVQYTLAAGKANGTQAGAQLFADNCAACHGQFGQGGPNPGRPGDMIPPISSAEFLATRDDTTLQNIVSQGQPDLGMNPFGSAYGGPLTDDQVTRLWPSSAAGRRIHLSAPRSAHASRPTLQRRRYSERCAQCHGVNGEGGSGLPQYAEFQAKYDDQALQLISDGIPRLR